MQTRAAVALAAAGLAIACTALRGEAEGTAGGQGWSDADRAFFYRTPQGTAFYPYAWFMALEQPGVPGSRFADQGFLSRFGFLRDELPGNADALPVGIAVDRAFVDPQMPEAERRPVAMVGFTCAACHTGEIHLEGQVVRIEGGPAMIELGAFRAALRTATAATLQAEAFSRFAARLLPSSAGEPERAALRERFQAFAVTRHQEQEAERAHAPEHPPEGWGRLAALDRIGNTLLSPGAAIARNLVPVDAPVSYPPIWGTPWFLWVQYNASILQPLARNVGEALGVNAAVDLRTFESTVQVENLAQLEALIAGPAFGGGLIAPGWPSEILPSIDPTKVDLGRGLYAELCQDCHLRPVSDPEMRNRQTPEWVEIHETGERYLALVEKPVVAIGTDPTAAENFAERRADLSAFGLARDVSVADALQLVTTRVPEVWFERHETPDSRRAEILGERSNQVRGRVDGHPVYRARPLDGVWATAPYLHNGSVPNLYELLSPVAERSKVFCVGSRAFDPVKVGLDPTCKGEATTRLDTTLKGNWNRGHEFVGDEATTQRGDLGRELTHEERMALIEFLKTL